MKKRILAAAAAVCFAMLSAGCSENIRKENPLDHNSEQSYSDRSSDESGGKSDTTDPADENNISTETLEAAYSNRCLTVYRDGRLSGNNQQSRAEEVRQIYSVKQLLSDESYQVIGEIYGVFESKRDYVEKMLENYPDIASYFSEDGELIDPPEPALFITFMLEDPISSYKPIDPEAEKQAFFRTAEWVMSKLSGKTLRSVNVAMDKRGYAEANVNYSIDEDGVIDVGATIVAEDGYSTLRDKFHVSGKEGFMLGDTFVLYDTEKLAVSSRDSFTFSLLAGDFIPDDCKIVCPKSEYSGTRIDFAEIAEKLPNLKELYMYQASGINQEAIADMKNLTSLSYYLLDDSKEFQTAFTDCPFKNLKNLRSLRLYANYEDYSFLNEMSWLTDIHIDLIDINKYGSCKTLFNCPGITSLTISGSDLDLDGIEKLTKLKKLEISCEVLDFAPLGKLKSLEDLHIRCTSTALNVSELSKAAKIKKLFLSGLKTKEWGFLKQMKNLTDLTLYYTPNVRNSDIAPLKQLKSLSLSETGCNVAAVGNLPNLEVYYESMSDGGDFSVFKKCTRLRELYLLGCRTGVMDFSYVQNCPLEIINCDGTEVTNVEQLANIKTLKSIYIATDEQNITCGDMLKEALPDCGISVDQPAFFHNHL